MNIPTRLSPELAEETGLHIGDGTMNFYKNRNRLMGSYALRGHIIDDKNHYQTRIKKLYKKIYDLDISLREMPSTGCFGFQKWSDDIVNFKSKILKLPLGKKLNIQIPKQFMNKYSTDLIRGIFDTDGTVYLENKNNKLYPRIIISNISNKLILQISKILKRENINSTNYITKRTQKNWNDLTILEVRGTKMLFKWFKLIKSNNQKHIDKYQYFLSNS